MAECTVRTRADEWIEVVLSTPTCAAELGKAHNIMLGQLGHENGTVADDDAYEVIVADDEIILRARRPSNRHRVTWAPAAVDQALAVLLDFRDGKLTSIRRESQPLLIAIDALRSLGGNPDA